MAEPTIQLGGGNWAGKSDNLLGYYKEGERFYKQDFTFSRSTTGTYTDKDGYIQEMPYNLLQQSNQFDTTWLTQDANVTSGEVGYDGSNDAWLFSWTSSTAFLYQSISLKASKNTISIYAKQGASSNLRLDFVTAGFSKGASCTFDLSNGTAGSVVQYGSSTDFTAAIDSVGSGWYRISLSGTTTATTWYHELALTSGSVYIQNAQLNKGTSAKTYFPTTTRLNMPRVDYLNNSNGSLILEPQRTNIATYSSDYTQSFYIKDSGITATLNQSTSPTGLNDAAKISVTNNGRIYANHTTGTYATSVFIKAGTFSNFKVQGQNVDLGVTPIVTGSLDSEDYGNGWYRLTGYYTGTRSFQVQAYPDNTYSSHTDSGDYYLFGTQIESGSYPTTLINTSGSSVTRNADVCIDGGDASRFNSSEGVLYAEIAALEETSSSSKYISISDETYNNRLSILFSSGATNQVRAFLRVGGTPQVDFNGSVTDVTDYNKVAFKYKANDFALWINGVEVATDISGSVFSADTLTKLSLSEINTTSNKFEGKVKQIQYYNTALSDSELATLTTL